MIEDSKFIGPSKYFHCQITVTAMYIHTKCRKLWGKHIHKKYNNKEIEDSIVYVEFTVTIQ